MSRKTFLIAMITIATLGCLETVTTQTVAPVSTSTLQQIPIATSTIAISIQTNTPTSNEIKTALEIKNLENQNKWGWINSATLISTFVIIMAGIIRFYQWGQEQKLEGERRAEDYQIEQAKLDEERFLSVLGGLGREQIEARVGAAIMLLTFLHHGYEKFYKQTFLLAAAHLRLRKAEPENPKPTSLDALSQALIIVFRDAFGKARDQITPFIPDNLDATGVNLDNAYLSNTDLRNIHMRSASLRSAHFWRSQLQRATLKHSNLEAAYFVEANLEEADLGQTNLKDANLTGAYLQGTKFHGATLDGAIFSRADLNNTHLEDAKSLQGTILVEAKGLSEYQLQEYVTRGAIINTQQSP